MDLSSSNLYINRELSTLEFNRRVLNEAYRDSHPLLERVKFLAIFSGNMDEFFMVRVSGLKQQVLLGISDRPADGLSPREQLVSIHEKMTRLQKEKMDYWAGHIREELEAEGIHILEPGDAIYYDSTVPHLVKCHGDDRTKILAVLYSER